MITIIDADARYNDNYGWVRVRRLIPVNAIYDHRNTYFANLLTVNEYTVHPGFGYDMHPHQNREMVFLVTDGELTCRDSLDHSIVMRPNWIQQISAGSGYAHANCNNGSAPATYIGVWFLPTMQNAAPASRVREFDPALWRNAWYPIASDAPDEFPGREPFCFNAAATLYRTTLDRADLSFHVEEGQKALLYVMHGELAFNGTPMRRGFHALVEGEEDILLRADGSADCLLAIIRKE